MFYFGTATSSFQIEGHPLADGACASDWYKVTHTPGMIKDGSNADIAADHYHRWPEDIALMKAMHLNAYRFSISWPRIISSKGTVNQAGLSFYSKLIDGLLEANITPFVTLFHWEMPQWLDDKGGWLCPESPGYFCDYTKIIFDAFGDRVRHWITINEPGVYRQSYLTGFHHPYHENNYSEFLLATNRLLNAHHEAANLFKSGYSGKIGIVHGYILMEPATQKQEDRDAFVRADGVRNRWYLDKAFFNRYPEDILALYGTHIPKECLEEKKPAPLDFFGLNYYSKSSIKDYPQLELFRYEDATPEFELQPSVSGYPAGLKESAKTILETYRPAEIYITENGWLEYESEYEKRDKLDDQDRTNYLKDHLEIVRECVQEGLPIKGYFHWSLLDNFEWRWGMERRYGLIHVDRATQDRHMKKSAKFYRDFIQSQTSEKKDFLSSGFRPMEISSGQSSQ